MSNKFIILGDVHIGARNASPILLEYQLQFFEDELLPYMKKHGINTILQLGDLFDPRKMISQVALYWWKRRLFDVLENEGIKLVTLVGNHDISFKNTLEFNTSDLFLHSYKNIEIIKEPTEYDFGNGVSFLLVPWVCDSNIAAVADAVHASESQYCAGHFEFSGFEMQKGVAAHGGMPADGYEKFDRVFSGHYHTHSKKKNITYTGVPYELTWADHNDQKGFYVFDSKTHKASYVKTQSNLFFRLEYNDRDQEPEDFDGLAGRYIKVVVINKTEPYKFEKYINRINEQVPADLKITDIEVDFDGVELDDEIEMDDTKTMIDNFIEQVDTELDKDRLKDMMQGLYLRALEITE